jgi:hypothetical protein
LLLTLGVCRLSVSPPHSDGALSPGRLSSPADISGVLPDLDGDGRADPVLFASHNLHHHIELHLSRTDERIVLPVSTVADGNGSLSVQDLDGDGDTDLLWQASLHSHAVRIWLNDGAGRFECLCPPDSRDQSFPLGSLGVNVAPAGRPANALSPERTSSSGDALTVRWEFHVDTTQGSYWPERFWRVSCLKRRLSARSPPLHLC